ncbi:MAG TPA: pilus assembly protein, partial [Pseudolabrys sp.]|nr:pilus assembly protein [Pseudolabrys sp.]
FLRARNGNVAVMFALALVPVLAATGAAIDFSRANSVKADLQAALDSTALMLSKQAATDTQAELQSQALTFFKATFNRPDAQNIAVGATYTDTAGSKLVVSGTVDVPTEFMQAFGYDSVTIGGSSTAEWGTTRLRVALVLDNTGSMAQDGKMSALKTATANLLTQLQGAVTTAGDVYVSIVPFVKDVNLGAANYTANWIDWTDWNAANGSCSGYTNYWGWGSPKTKSSCLSYHGTWTSNSHQTWNGCVVDRGSSTGPDLNDYDTNVDAPTTSITATLYAAEQYQSCPQAAMGLSYNWNAMNTLVTNMQPAGNTNQAIGLQLGWLSLVGGGPFTAPPEDDNHIYQKVIILLTDGLNTQDRWYTNESDIDAREQMTCNNIKAAGVTLYTIQVNTGGDPTSTLLQNCASSSDKFFLLTSANQIVATFNAIGTNLSKLRVVQ